MLDQQLGERCARLRLVGGDDHPLAGGQPVGLDHHRIAGDRVHPRGDVAHHRVGRRGHAGGDHHLLAERLRPLQASRRRPGPEAADAGGGERIADARPPAAPRGRPRRGRSARARRARRPPPDRPDRARGPGSQPRPRSRRCPARTAPPGAEGARRSDCTSACSRAPAPRTRTRDDTRSVLGCPRGLARRVG